MFSLPFSFVNTFCNEHLTMSCAIPFVLFSFVYLRIGSQLAAKVGFSLHMMHGLSLKGTRVPERVVCMNRGIGFSSRPGQNS